VSEDRGDGGADVLDAGWIPAPPEDDVLRVIGEQPEPFLAVPQGRLRGAALAAAGGFAQLAFDGRYQTGQPVLEHEVVGTGAHQRGGGLLADLARDQDERDIDGRIGTQQPQRLVRPESGYVVVADDHVGCLVAERRGQAGGGLDTTRRDVDPGPPELPEDEQGVVVAVLDDEQSDRHGHASPRHIGAGSFINSQYTPSTRVASTNSANTTGLRT
jgi:hypothetical protein